jgi:hypothetical protein
MENNVFLQVETLDFVPIGWDLLYNDEKLELEIERLNKRTKNALGL